MRGMEDHRKDGGGVIAAILAGCAIIALAVLFVMGVGGFFVYRSIRVATEEEAAAMQAEQAARDLAAEVMAKAKADSLNVCMTIHSLWVREP